MDNAVKVTLKAARVNANLTIYDVASALKVTPQSIRRWENGGGEPKASAFLKLCELYHIPPANIFLAE